MNETMKGLVQLMLFISILGIIGSFTLGDKPYEFGFVWCGVVASCLTILMFDYLDKKEDKQDKNNKV